MRKKFFFVFVCCVLAAAAMFSAFIILRNRPQPSERIDSRNFQINPAARTARKNFSPIKTADPNATAETKKLLSYFYGYYEDGHKNKVLIGQNVGDANFNFSNSYSKYFSSLERSTGKLPAIIGVNYGWEKMLDDYSETNSILIDHWQKGGLVYISMHPANPFTAGEVRDIALGGHKFDEVFDPSSDVNKRLVSDLDRIAAGLQQLQEAGVVVLWRPLHEMNGDWFWWSFGTGDSRLTDEEYKKLWVYIFDYLTAKKGLHNLLWMYAPYTAITERSLLPAYYYPGDEYVDIVALDYYQDSLDLLNARGSYDSMVALGKPLGLAEIGPANSWTSRLFGKYDNFVTLKNLSERYPDIIFFSYWSGWSVLGGLLDMKMTIGENRFAKELLNSPLVITTDETGLK